MNKGTLYTVVALGLLMGMVGLGATAAKLRVPFVADDDAIKGWVVVAAAIALVGVVVWRMGGELAIALATGRWRELRFYEHNPMVEEAFDSARPLAEIACNISERLAGLEFETQPPAAAGEGLKIVAEKPKTRTASGFFFNPLGIVAELIPVEQGVRVRVLLTQRTVCVGDVAADRRKMRQAARYITGELREPVSLRMPPVSLDLAMIGTALLIVLIVLGKGGGKWESLGEAAQLMAAICALLGGFDVIRNRQVTRGLPAAIALGAAAAWPAAAHGLLLWQPVWVETPARWVYVIVVLAVMGMTATWWRTKMAKVSPVYQVPKPGKPIVLGWRGVVLLFAVCAGVVASFIGGALLVESLGMTRCEEVRAENLGADKWPTSKWVRLHGEADWGRAVWVGSGSSKRYFVPMTGKLSQHFIEAFLELEESQMGTTTERVVSVEGAEGIVATELPERAAIELDKEGLEMGDRVLVVIYQRLPWQLRRDALVILSVGVILLTACAGFWLRRRRVPVEPVPVGA